MSEIVSGVVTLAELTAGSAVRASGVLSVMELNPASAVRVSGVLILVEVLDPTIPDGITPLTLNTRSIANTLRTKRKTYTTLNDRTAALTLEERP